MGDSRRKFDKDFREGAVRLVRETGKPIAQVARDLGINSGTLGNWVDADRRRRGEGDRALSEDERAELARLRKENAELAMRCDVISAVWPFGYPMRLAGSRCRAPGGRRRRIGRAVQRGWRPSRNNGANLRRLGEPPDTGCRQLQPREAPRRRPAVQ